MAQITRIHPAKDPIPRGGVTIEFENEVEYQGFIKLLNGSVLVANVLQERNDISWDENKALKQLLSDIYVLMMEKEPPHG